MNFKRMLSTATLVLAGLCTFAQIPVEVTGLLAMERPGTVKLYKVSDGELSELASSIPGKDGRFGFAFYPEYEGLYVLGTGKPNSPTDQYTFYFKGGDKLSVVLKNSTYELSGTSNSKENVVMWQWFKLTDSIYQKSINFMRGGGSSTFVDFFPQLEDVVAKSKQFLKGKATGNLKFDRRMKDIMEMDLANYASNFLNTPRVAHPSVEEFSPYYNGLGSSKLSQTASKIYEYPWGKRVFEATLMINMRQKNIPFKEGIEGVKTVLPLISNDTLKGDFVIQRMAGLKNYSDYTAYMEAFSKYFLTDRLKKRQIEIAAPLATLKTGEAAFNFSYQDKDGKTVSMADLKGKVVLVDVWATWCGPCKAQIPYLKKLEEDMKNKDVQMVSISVDEARDKEKWLKMIKDENLGGLQLFASGWGDLSKYYKIDAIPRFMVFDKAGKIISVDAPRPSAPELKALLEKTLAN
jgi:thiol-disulfide isomerase/thioredoxin